MIRISAIEPLESRIAPAILIANPIFDQTATAGKTGASIDLGILVDAAKSYRTVVDLVTKYGNAQTGTISIELFDDKAPLTVANFLRTVNNPEAAADYSGTLFNRFISGFVLQGGGFNAATPTKHNDTFATLHNEFDATDSSRSNIIQTVAMAKVGSENGGGPNSATDEFFINLGNNASNLDNQNGGFTVFGRVTDATFPVVTAITALPITQAQKTEITDAHVQATTPANAVGYTFSVESVTDSTTGATSDLVTTAIDPATHQLGLTYSTTKNGVAKVKVKISKTGEADVFDEFLVTVKPNLIANVLADGLLSTFIPADTGTAKVKIINTAGGAANGTASVKLYLSESNRTASDTAGYEFTDADTLLGQSTDIALSLGNDADITIPVPYHIPATGLVEGKSYRVLAKIETLAGTTIQELFTDDNVGNLQGSLAAPKTPLFHTYRSGFGTFEGRGNIEISTTDSNGDSVTFHLSGKGNGLVTKNATDGSLDVTISGTDAKSKLAVKTAKGIVADIDDLFIPTTIGKVSLGNVHLHGNFTASTGAKSIVLGDLGNTDTAHPENDGDRTFDVGLFPVAKQKLALSLGKVRDYTLHSDMVLASLTAKEWLNNAPGVANSITAANLGTLKIAGALEANVFTLGDGDIGLLSVGGDMLGNIAAHSIAALKIKGGYQGDITALGDGTFTLLSIGGNMFGNITAHSLGALKITGNLTGDVSILGSGKTNLLSVGGALSGSTVKTSGDIATVKLGSISSSSFLAGLSAKPTALADFASARAIAKFTVAGGFADSTIAAGTLGSISIGSVDAAAGTTLGGIYADAIKSYLRKGTPPVKKSNLTTASTNADTLSPNYQVQVF